jgi:hypothetical protein
MSYQTELQGKIVQALLVWREQGGPTSISVSDATEIASQKNPGITETEMRSIVRSHNALQLKGDEIMLSPEVISALK